MLTHMSKQFFTRAPSKANVEEGSMENAQPCWPEISSDAAVRSRMERLKQVSRDQDEAVRREQFLASYEDARQGVQDRMRNLMAQLRTEMLRSPAAQKQKQTAVPPTWTEDPGDEDPSPADVLHDTKVLQQFSEKAAAPKEHCNSCGVVLGKRHLNPKHQCRLCGAMVCATCSPNSLKLDEGSAAQRVCNPCVEIVPQQPDLVRRLDALARYLETHVGRPSEGDFLEASASVDAALGRCEGLQRALGEERMRLMAKLEEVTETCATRARLARAGREEEAGPSRPQRLG
eukprot:s1096_g2.t1